MPTTASTVSPVNAAPTFTCPICEHCLPTDSSRRLDLLHSGLAGQVAGMDLPEDCLICEACLAKLHGDYFEQMLKKDAGELDSLEQEVIASIRQRELISENPEVELDEKASTGQRVADRVASFGGSWTFIISFGVFLTIWIAINSLLLGSHAYDPYPFILLNLMLSMIAALQAPVIMMSQNRQETKDRRRAEKDYQVNLKAELQIRHLHSMIEHLMFHHWKRLLEMQELQMKLLEELHAAQTTTGAAPNPATSEQS